MFLIVLIIVKKSFGQFNQELFTVNYTYAPTGNDDHNFIKTDLQLNIPIRLSSGILINTISFNYYQTTFVNDIIFNTVDLEKNYGINYGLMYTFNLSDKWSLAARGGVSLTSNLTNGISGDDLVFNGGLMGVKRGGTTNKPSKLMFGIGYATITGKPRVIPLINYTKKVSEKFSYGIGFPKSNASYNINERSTLKSILWMNGYYSNLSDPVDIGNNNNAEKSSFSAIALGLDYSYRMDESLSIVFKGGYSIKSKYDLLDNDNNIIYSFDSSAKPYFSTGIKFNINKRFNNKIK